MQRTYGCKRDDGPPRQAREGLRPLQGVHERTQHRHAVCDAGCSLQSCCIRSVLYAACRVCQRWLLKAVSWAVESCMALLAVLCAAQSCMAIAQVLSVLRRAQALSVIRRAQAAACVP